MTSTQELRKPTFVKVKDLQRERSGYNVIVKVVSAEVRDIETKSGLKIKMVDAVVGDETGVAKAFFKGDNATHIQKGKVVAIRNGLKKFIKNFISLELDIFGRVTQQKAEFTVNQSYNISEQEHKLPERPRGPRNDSPRRGGFNRGRGNRGGRPQRGGYNNDRNDRPPRRYNDNDNRPPRRQNNRYGDRQQNRQQNRQGRQQNRQGRQQNRQNRQQNRQQNRPYRQNNRNYENRGADRDNRQPRRQYDRDFDRRRDTREDNRPPRRQQQRYEPRRQEFRERKPIQWTKIDEISPGDDRINLIAKVISQELVQGRRTMLRCTIGDETGLVRAFFPESDALRVGKTIALFDCEARVVKQHIEVQIGRNGRIDAGRKEVQRVNEKFNLSDKSWVPADN